MVKYYSVHYPIFAENFKDDPNICGIIKFKQPKFCDEILRNAWGYVVCKKELTEEEMTRQELVKGAAV